MDPKTPAESPCSDSSEPQAYCVAYYRGVVARAKALQAIATTASLRRYLDEVIMVFERQMAAAECPPKT
jgi:hypothetical protein